VWWQSTGPDDAKKIVWNICCQALEVPEKLQRYPVAHFLMREELPHALFM
jgi:hypothetical protein